MRQGIAEYPTVTPAQISFFIFFFHFHKMAECSDTTSNSGTPEIFFRVPFTDNCRFYIRHEAVLLLKAINFLNVDNNVLAECGIANGLFESLLTLQGLPCRQKLRTARMLHYTQQTVIDMYSLL
jgi:hypothetical protein